MGYILQVTSRWCNGAYVRDDRSEVVRGYALTDHKTRATRFQSTRTADRAVRLLTKNQPADLPLTFKRIGVK